MTSFSSLLRSGHLGSFSQFGILPLALAASSRYEHERLKFIYLLHVANILILDLKQPLVHGMKVIWFTFLDLVGRFHEFNFTEIPDFGIDLRSKPQKGMRWAIDYFINCKIIFCFYVSLQIFVPDLIFLSAATFSLPWSIWNPSYFHTATLTTGSRFRRKYMVSTYL